MSFDQLQKAWASQATVSLPLPDQATLVARVKTDSREFDRLIWRRDAREIGAGLLVLAVFAWQLRQAPGPGWAYWTTLGPVVAVTVFFLATRVFLAWKRRQFGPTMTGELAWSVCHTRFQIALLTRVVWWYLLPLFVAAMSLGVARAGRFTLALWPVGLVMVLVCGFVYWLNLRAARQTLQPKLDQLLAVDAQWRAIAATGDSTPDPSATNPRI